MRVIRESEPGSLCGVMRRSILRDEVEPPPEPITEGPLMNTTSDAPISAHFSLDRPVHATGLVVGVIAAATVAWGSHGPGDLAVLITTVVAATALVFGVVVPRALRTSGAGGTALWLSLPALVILFPLFWSGLPLVLGAGGVLVGLVRRHDPTGGTRAVVGLVLGTLAVVGYAGIYLIDGLLLGNI